MTNFFSFNLALLRKTLIFLLALGFVGESTRASRAQSSPPKLDGLLYVTRNKNMQELGDELGRLYVSAANQGRLTVAKFDVGQPDQNIETLFRTNNLFKGAQFPLPLESLACDLNPQMCKRQKTPADPDQLRDITAHVFGSKPSRSQWRLMVGDTVVLPAIRLEDRVQWARYDKKSGQIFDDILRELGGCARLDERCKRDIKLRNKAQDDAIFDKEYQGTLILPILTCAANIDLATAADQALTISNELHESPRIESSGGVVLQEMPVSQSIPQGTSYKLKDVPTLTGLEFPPAAKIVRDPASIPAIGGNLIGGATAINRQAVPEPLDGGTRELTMKDFDTDRSEVMALLKLQWKAVPYPSGFRRQVNVGVFDSEISTDHCAFAETRFAAGMPMLPFADSTVSTSSKKTCMRLAKADEDTDHGTHVAGIVVARDPKGPQVGLNPYAGLYPYTVNFSALPEPSELDKFATDLDRAAQDPALDIVNLSFGYLKRPGSGPLDPIERAIMGLEKQTLFVAAAGNYGADQTNICDIRPACFDLPNVISVAALDRDSANPKLLVTNGQVSSNFGSKVHIGAVGQQVLSTVKGDRYGYMSGTSSAAPQVTAVASLLLAKYRQLLPIEVKNRLIYCSDAIDKLGNKLFGGRLDANCVLNGDWDRVWVQGNEIEGTIQKGTKLLFREKISAREISLLTDSVRGMSYDPSEQVFTVYYNATNRRDSKLYKETNLQPGDANQAVVIAPSGKPTISIRIGDIKRFASSAAQ